MLLSRRLALHPATLGFEPLDWRESRTHFCLRRGFPAAAPCVPFQQELLYQILSGCQALIYLVGIAPLSGFEPKITESESVVLPVTPQGNGERVPGFEPGRTTWKAVMLAVKHHTRIAYCPPRPVGLSTSSKL